MKRYNSFLYEIPSLSAFLCSFLLFNAVQTIDQLIETGDSEQIFQKAIQEQGRGQVCLSFFLYSYLKL